MNTIPCMNCETALPVLGGGKKPYCLTEECALVYARWFAFENVEKRGECDLWLGNHKHRTGQSFVFSVKVAPGKTRSYRVLALREEDISVAHGKVYYNQCGNERCVVLAHHELRTRPAPIPHRHNPDAITAKLPAEPLLTYYDCHRRHLTDAQHEVLRKARIKGHLTVTAVDTFCIDALEIHPAVVYGDLFWDAA